MPLPEPNKGESQDEFVERCMGNETMKDEFPDNDQRLGVCHSQWKKRSRDIDRRHLAFETAELRVKDEGRTLAGYAAVFDSDSEDLGGFIERIKPGAFKGALERSDIRALFNHEPSQLLGRTASGTLTVAEDDRGLLYEVRLPDTHAAQDIAKLVTRGDITGNSFSFRVAEDGEEWETREQQNVRTITQFEQVFDVGPVTYPAYVNTEVSLRSLAQIPKKAKRTVDLTRRKADLGWRA